MRYLSLFICLIVLASCTAARELPENNGDSSDVMKISPCVCNEIEYNRRGYQWLS